jgi:pyruvate dehydrogenase E2 component (dihydrolipoamide acetyltransferase)
MPTEFTLPELGENIAAGDVIRVLVKQGDAIQKEQPVLELETDKATIEVPSSVSGTVSAVKVKAGDKVKVGQAILTVDEAAAAPEQTADQKAAGTIDKAAGTIDEKQVAASRPASAKTEWDVPPTPDAPPEAMAPLASSKADAPRAGSVPASPKPEAGSRAEAGPASPKPEGTRAEAGKRPATILDMRPSRPLPEAAAPEQAGPVVPAAPSVRRLARELGVDIARVPGSGPGGRVAPEDVNAFVRSGAARPPSTPTPDVSPSTSLGASQATGFEKWGEIERKPMTGIRRKTAEHLSAAWQAPHVTQHDRADVTALEDLRRKYAPRVEKAGGKLTVTAIAAKIAAEALRRFPQFNTALDLAAKEIIHRKYVHIGIAVDTERGLLVPVIRDADRKTITEISAEVAQLSEKARARKLTIEEMEGGSFTITNLGGIGGTAFTPIINAPEVAILGLSRSAIEPVWRPRPTRGASGERGGASPTESERNPASLEADGEFEFAPRLILPLSLSYDHRAIDGADAARFLRWIVEAMENPLTIFL